MSFPKSPKEKEIEGGLTLFVRPPSESVEVGTKDTEREEVPLDNMEIKLPQWMSAFKEESITEVKRKNFEKQVENTEKILRECNCVGEEVFLALDSCQLFAETVFRVLDKNPDKADSTFIMLHQDPDDNFHTIVEGESGKRCDFSVDPEGKESVLETSFDGKTLSMIVSPNRPKIREVINWALGA